VSRAGGGGSGAAPPHGEVHLWLAGVAELAERAAALLGTLSADERDRAGRFHREADWRRFVVARGALRIILARYLGSDARALAFRYGPFGKPELPDAPLRFNLSHSGDLALCAVTRGRAVGVDVEQLRPVADCEQLAARYFSPEEHAALVQLSAAARSRAFLACWTRKEAYVKARGDGLSFPLDAFAVSLAPGTAPALLRHRLDATEVDRWSFAALEPEPGYVGALAVEGHGWRLVPSRLRPDDLPH
jgi:4'-phosphopantetheinyl transferase